MFKSAFGTHIGSKNTVRTVRTPHRAIAAACGLFTFSEVGRPDWKQWTTITNNYHFTDELVLTEGEIVEYGTTTGSFQQNFGVFTDFNNVFYDR